MEDKELTVPADAAADVTPVSENPPTGGGDPKEQLYKKLVADKLYSKSYDDFQKQFSTPEKVNRLHDYLTNKGKYDKGADAFQQQFFSDVKASKDVNPPGPPVAVEPKKKDLSGPASPNGGAPSPNIKPLPLNPIPDVTQPQQPSVLFPNQHTLDAQAVAAQSQNEQQAQQQKIIDQNHLQQMSKINLLGGGDPASTSFPMVMNPEARKQLMDKQEAEQTAFQKQLSDAQKAYSEAHGGEAAPTASPDDATISQHKDPTVWSSIKFGAKYLGSQLAKGGTDVLQAGSHTLQTLDKLGFSTGIGSAGSDEDIAEMNKAIEDKTDLGMTKGVTEGSSGSKVLDAVGTFARIAPAVVASEPTGGASFYLQGVGQAAKQVQEMKDKGVKFEHHTDELYIQGLGMINFLVGKSVVGSVLGKGGDAVINGASADAVRELAAKGADATADDLANAYLNSSAKLIDKIEQHGVNALKSYATIGTELAAANVATTGLKQVINKINDSKTFDVHPSEYIKDVASPFFGDNEGKGPVNALLGVLSAPATGLSLVGAATQAGHLFDGSPYRNVVLDNLQKNNDPANVEAIKANLKDYGERNHWSDDEIANTGKTVDMLAEIARTVPPNLPRQQFRDAVGTIADRRTLEEVLKQTQEKKAGLDPAIAGKVTPFENLLKARIDQANDRVSEIVTGKKFTYFEYEGNYFKQQPGEEYQSITKDRYDLEHVDNTSKPADQKSLVMPEGTTDKKGNPVPSPAPKEGELPAPPAIAPEEYQKFVDTGDVSKETVNAIAQKVRDKQPLTDQEKAIFAAKTDDINEAIRQSLLPKNNDKSSEGKFAKKEVPEEPKPTQPTATTPPAPSTDEAAKDNAATAVTSKQIENGKNNETEASPEKGTQEKGISKEGRQSDEELLKPQGKDNTSPTFSHEGEADRHWAQHETDPEAIASRYHLSHFDPEHTADYKEAHINNYLGNTKINANDFARFGDNNLLKGDPAFKRRWIDTNNKGLPIDTQAQELTNKIGLEVTPQDIVDFVTKYKGNKDFVEQAKSPFQKDLENRYKELTGNDLTDQRAEDAYNKQAEKLKTAKLDADAQDIIEREGITLGNIDKLKGQFTGFPYTPEDFDNVKRYLDHERTQGKQGKNAPAPKGTTGTQVGSTEPTKPGTESRPAGPTNGGATNTGTTVPTGAVQPDEPARRAKSAIEKADDLEVTKNTHPDGGKKPSAAKNLEGTDKARFDELRKKLKSRLKNFKDEDNTASKGEQFSGGDTPDFEFISDGMQLTSLYFKAGIRSFEDYAGEMIADMGEDVIPYLKAFYEGAKNFPFQDAYKHEFSDTDTVDYHVAKLTDKSDPVRVFIDRIKGEITAGNKMTILHLEGLAREAGLNPEQRTTLQEYVEQGLLEMAREIIDDPFVNPKEIPAKLIDLYDKQPSLLQRSSTKVALQQYSTPLPYAHAAGLYVNAIDPSRVYDPTAGTGNLSLAFNPGTFFGNELDKTRLQILKNLGLPSTAEDALKYTPSDIYEGIVANPPFGGAPQGQVFNNYPFSLKEQIIPLRALQAMPDHGRAAIIIGGHSEYDAKGTLKGSDFRFFNYLHHYYNVTDVINVDGGLYAKQGTSYPTRLILINGRKEVPQGFAPAHDEEANKPVKSFQELYNRIQERINQDERPSVLQSRVDVRPPVGDDTDGGGAEGVQAKNGKGPGAVSGSKGDETGGGRTPGERAGGAGAGRQTELTDSLGEPDGDSEGADRERQLVDVPKSLTDFARQAEEGTIGPERSGGFVPDNRPIQSDRPTADQLVENDKIPYVPGSRLTQAGSVIPSNMAYETAQNLDDLQSLYGPLDTFVANELGYADLDDLANAFFAEQVDAIAMGIHQLKQGKAMIIGDMTGIGKGRIAAGLIRYAVMQGKTPIFFTENADLFSDIYRDMYGIGAGHFVPFIVNDPSGDRDANVKREGKVVYRAGTIKDKKKWFEAKQLPHGTKVILSTYSQLNSEKQILKRAFITHHAKDNFLFLDESHNVAGESNSGEYFQGLLAQAKGVGFLSATYAKRADNMPVYAIKTSMSDANMSSDALVDAIRSGGNALQEIVASQLVKAGQMIRRERDFNGVVNHFNVLGVDEDGKMNDLGAQHRKLADEVIDACNAIIQFENEYVVSALWELQQRLRKEKGQRISQTKSKQLSVSITPFASKMFNIVNQMLFSIKAESLAHEAVRLLKEENKKPVITFNSTMESFIKNEGYKPGDTITDTSFAASLLHGLKKTLSYRVELPNGDKYTDFMNVEDLGEEGMAAYQRVVEQLKSASSDISISPIDTITEILENAGLKVGEITGRKTRLRFNEDHSEATVESVGEKDTMGIIHDFNNGGGGGKADVILLNAAGATGFSMHADKSFKDQRERQMLNGQLQLDINKEIQIRGRVDRTNQVRRASYQYMNTAIPAESRLAMMFASKLKQLQANTTSDQKSKANEVKTTDFLNEYGDHVMTDYLRDHPDIYEKLYQGGDPAGIKGLRPGQRAVPVEGIARKSTGRAALLKVAEQEKFYDEVSQSYNDYIDYLNSTDQNQLAVKSVNLEAKTLSKGTFIEGKHTQSPFGQDSVLEKVEANVLRKPMTKEELDDAIAKNLNGVSAHQRANELVKEVNDHYREQYEKVQERAKEDYEKQDEKDRKKYGSNQELYKVAHKENLERRYQRQEDARNSFEESSGKIASLFRDFNTGGAYRVPTSMSGEETKYTPGIFLGFSFKESKNKFSPSNILMKFAVLDGKRTITVAASRGEFTSALYAGKAQASRIDLEQLARIKSDWEGMVKDTKARETRYIVTGNILQAYRANIGQLVSYTTHDGKIEKGILMSKGFDPKQEGKYVGAIGMFEHISKMKVGESVVTNDGNMTIARTSATMFAVEVPKTTSKGGKYFKNDALLDLVQYGEFYTHGQSMIANLHDYNLMDFLKALDKQFGTKFLAGIEMTPTPGNEAADKADNDTADITRPRQPYIPKEPENGPVEHDLVKSKSTERIQASNRMPHDPETGKPVAIKKLPDIIADLAKGINVQIYHAKSVRKGAAGSYSPYSGGIKLSSINNLDTAVHEVGHALDDAYKLYDSIPGALQAQAMDELQWFADRGGSNPPGTLGLAKKIEYLKREGIAEFVRAYAINPAMARMKAPVFYDHFENTIPKDILDVIHQFGEDYLRYINGTEVDRIMANIEEAPKEARSAFKKLIDSFSPGKEGKFHLSFWDHLATRFTNSMRPFEKGYDYLNMLSGKSTANLLPEDNPNVMARLFAGVNDKVGAIFRDGLVNGKNEPLIDGRTGQRINLQWLYSAFDSTSPETLARDQALSIAYMFAERTIEKAMQFDRKQDISGISAAGAGNDFDAAANFLIKEFGQQLTKEEKKRVIEGARRYQLWSDKTLRYMVEKGRMSESVYRDIKEKNLAYVAFLPVQENHPGIESYFDNPAMLSRVANMGSVKQVLREMTGSTQFKRHPYVSLMQNTAAMVKEADRNEILQAFVEPMINTMRSMGEGDVNPFANVMMEVSSGEKMQGKPVMTVFLNGQPKYYMFSEEAKDIYQYVNGLTKLPQLPGFVTVIPKMVRFSATRFPVFAARHFIRSTFTRLIVTRTGSQFGDFIKDRDGEKGLYHLYGGSQTGYYLSNRTDYYKLQQQVIKQLTGTGKGIVLNPVTLAKKGWEGYEHLLQKSDLANRLAEFRSAYEYASKPKSEGGLGYDEYNANLYAAAQARDLVDSAVSGTWIRYINQIMPFTNVQIQGLKRNFIAASEGGARERSLFALRLALYTVLPTLLMRLLAKQGDYEEEYDNLPSYQRDMFWNFKIPGMESWISISKPYDLGLVASGIDRSLGAAAGDENAWTDYYKSMYQNLAIMNPELTAGPGAALVEPITNYSFFKQGPIVPRFEEDKNLALRKHFNEASRIGKAGSMALSPFFDKGDSIDPRYIDALMQSMFSYYGETAMNLADIGSKESRQKFGLSTTGFIKNQQIYGDNRVEKVYDKAKALGMTESKPIKYLGYLIRNYYNATEPDERTVLHNQIMEYSKNLMQQWKDMNIEDIKLQRRGQDINFK